MYVNSGYLFNSRVPFKEKKMPLRILSAGTYQLFTWPKLPTWRPKGRVDWQIIYIAAGEGHFFLNGQEVVVPAGNMVLYQPKQQQKYFYYGKDRTQVWFVHFTGREVRSILKHYEIPLDGYILHTGIAREFEDLFRKMRDELVKCAWGYEEMLTYLFRELMLTIHRRMMEDAPRVSGFIQEEMDRAKAYFEEKRRPAACPPAGSTGAFGAKPARRPCSIFWRSGSGMRRSSWRRQTIPSQTSRRS